MDVTRTAAIHGVAIRLQRHSEQLLEDYIFQTVSGALKDWDLTLRDIDNVVTASSDQLDGRAISCMVTGGPAGAYRKDLINISSASEHALVYAAGRINAGRARLTLVVSWGKPSEAPIQDVDRISLDPFFFRPTGLTRSQAYDLETMAYRARAAITEKDIRSVVAKNRDNARNNPRSILSGLSVDSSGEELPYSIPADGVVALLVGGGAIRPSGKIGAAIKGMGVATGSYWADAEDLAQQPALLQAARAAYQQASIDNPESDLDFVELSDVTPSHEIIAYEGLRLAPRGRSLEWLRREAYALGGSLPVNPSGGLAGGYPDFAAGLCRVGEAALQLLGKAGPVSVDGARRGLGHARSGFLGGSHTVFVLERQES